MSYRLIDTSDYQRVMETYNVSSLTAKMLMGMETVRDDIASFFLLPGDFQFDPALYQPIADCLWQIKKQGRKVFVFGDYDCDGICATAIMVAVLEKMGIKAGYYIPSRINEGYGLSLDKLMLAADKGYDVLVTVDNGVAAQEALKWAREHDITTIVTDHHVITQEVDCDYLLHPDLMGPGCENLCGAAVAYMLARYLKLDDDRMKVLAMTATIGDVMEIKGLNIRIINEGLELLNTHRVPEVERLVDFNYPVDETQIGFQLVPMINSGGRMSEKPVSEANLAVRYFLTSDMAEKGAISALIRNFNQQRKRLSASEYELAKEIGRASCRERV